MKIAHLTPEFSAFVGVSKAVYALAAEQNDRGDGVTIFALAGGDMKPPRNVQLRIIPMPQNSLLRRAYRLIMPLDIRNALKYVPKLKHFDVIYGHFYPMIWLAYLAKRFYGVKFVYYNYGEPHPELLSSFVERTYVRILIALRNWIIKRADGAISISQYLQRQLNQEVGLASEVFYPKVDATRFHEGLGGLLIRDKYNLGSSPLILSVGRILPHKGCHLLIQTFALVRRRVTSARLVIVGTYPLPLASYYRKLRQMADDSVIFTGYVGDDELPYYYAACDIYATATLWEGFNLPLVEAQACGKPVAAFNIGPHPEVVKDGKTGFLVPPEDTNALAEAVIRLLKNDKLRQEVGQNAYNTVKEKFL